MINVAKCKMLHLARGNPKHEYRLSGKWIESSLGEKHLGLLVDKELNMIWECELTAQKAGLILGCIQSSLGSRVREGNLSFYLALMRPSLECHVQLWGPQHKKDMDLLEHIHKDDESAGAPLLWRHTGRIVVVQPREDSRETSLQPFSI
ncbi:hypothetical protein DUI87_16928 [Hirundo rustica rustica]|uniref:Uncharacterized protein n=1 Tax=Hirundo rustica rustica TaxID=333673 RepID=A0A3M0K2R3_HIRRU|nr:hypothetical protein DUI87_16928 [Hirundo rustica rustica]